MKKLTFIVFLSVCLVSGAQDMAPGNNWLKTLEYLDNNDYLRAIEVLEQMLKQDPEHAGALNNLALALEKMGDKQGSCEAFEKAFQTGYTKNTKYYDYYCDREAQVKSLQSSFYRNEVLLPEKNYRPEYTLKDTLRGALRKERTCYDVVFYDLSIEILPRSKSIRGVNTIFFKALDAYDKIQIDLFDNMLIDSIVHKGKKLEYKRVYNAVFVQLKKPLAPGTYDSLKVYYQGRPVVALNPPWEGGFVWARDRLVNQWVGVACEHLGASAWWPNKDHLYDEPDSFLFSIEVPQKYQAIANGSLRGVEQTSKKTKRYQWFIGYPINNYNLTFYMGKYQEFTDSVKIGNKWLTCRYHVLPQNVKKAKAHFKQANDVVKVYSDIYGPYPFWDNDFRMVESPYEGMEHQTAIAYGNGYNNKRSAYYNAHKNHDYIIVHEAAHEWWGNAVSAEDMADAWIHEAFATYSEFLFIESKYGRKGYLDEVYNHIKFVRNFWPMVENRHVNENSFASSDIYFKGATMLHCLRATINNDSAFFGLLKAAFREFKFKTINSYDFIEFVNNYTGRNYTPFFSKYLMDNELPVLSYKYTRQGNNIEFSYKWAMVKPGFFMPFSLDLRNGNALRLEGTTEWQTTTLENAETFMFFLEKHGHENLPQNGYTYYWTHKAE